MINELNAEFNIGNNNFHAYDRDNINGRINIDAADEHTIDDAPVGDYYDYPYCSGDNDRDEPHQQFCIHWKLIDFCEKNGWWIEWETSFCLVVIWNE